MLYVVLDICVHWKVFERENDPIHKAELKLCVNNHYLFQFECRHL